MVVALCTFNSDLVGALSTETKWKADQLISAKQIFGTRTDTDILKHFHIPTNLGQRLKNKGSIRIGSWTH